MEEKDEIQDALARLDCWIENEKFKGYEPHDALNSLVLRQMCFGNRLMGIMFLQTLRRLPINLRPVLGIPKKYNPKAFGLFLSTCARRYECFHRSEDLRRASFFAKWLRENAAPGYSHLCWGYPFPWPNRASFVLPNTPTAVNTSFISFGFLDLNEYAGDPEALEVAKDACAFFINELNRLESSEGICFSYTPLDRRFVHNANMLVAASLMRTGHLVKDPDLMEAGSRAVQYTVSRQTESGAWPYGEGSREEWIDNFHTGFVLNSLADCIDYAEIGDVSLWRDALWKGYLFYKTHFFLSEGIPKYYLNSLYPIDAHSVAQGILTFLRLRHLDVDGLEWAQRIALWAARNMQDRAGYFHYQIHRFYRNRIPYMRWTQAWMQRALTELMVIHATD